MPLVRFEVRNEYGLGLGANQGLFGNIIGGEGGGDEQPKVVLDGVAVAGLVGILRQLGDLAEFAAEVFHGLQEQVVTTASRSHKMLLRVQHIEAALPPLEKAVLAQTSHIHFAYTAGCEWHPKIRVKQKHFIHSDLPSFILDSYEECHDPPRLHLLDKFDTGGPGTCLRRYSDPSFFRKAITRSELMNTEKVQREKRVRKSKKKSSRWRNGELSHVLSTSQCSSRMQFGSPSSYGQSSTGETVSTIHMGSRSEQGDQSMSFDSRARSGYIECVFEGSSSTQQEDNEHNRLPTAPLKMQDGGENDTILCHQQKLDDNMTHGSLEDLHSSSVTWDEKTEIVEPKINQSDNIVGDGDVASELLRESTDLAMELSEAALQKNIVPDVIMCSADIPEPLSEVDEFDEAGSEPDNYADALNTLESEAEADSECQTKREVEKPLGTLKCKGINTGETHTIVQKSELSTVEFCTAPYSSSKKEISPGYSNSVSSDDVVCTQPPEITTLPSDPDISVNIGFSEGADVLDVSRVDGCESSTSYPSSSLSTVPISQLPLHDKIVSTLYESQGSLQKVSETSSVNVWTNGCLLGLEPSKPSDYCMPSGEHCNSMAFTENNANGHNIVLSESHLNGLTRKVDALVKTCEQREKSPTSQVGRDKSPDMVSTNDLHSDQLTTISKNMAQTVDLSDCCASYHDKQGDNILNSLQHLSAVSEAGLGKAKYSCQSCSLSNAHERDSNETGVVISQGKIPAVADGKFPSSESSQKNIECSSSMFGLSQRFHANGYQRKESLLRGNTSGPLGYVKTGIARLDEHHSNHQIGKGNATHHFSAEKNSQNQPENGSLVNSLPSSPPLQHMKISFYPMDGFETSKLRLKFPGGYRFHESIEDVIFPSFQLLPEPAIVLHDIDSESENDTFCRSSPYLSEELMSQHSESSSEQWESDDTPDSNDHEIYDALRRVSSVESILSAFELQGISNGSIHFENGFKSSALNNNGVKKFHSDTLFDLPSFDTVSSLASQQERRSDSSTKDHQDLELQYPKEEMPPPLPPVEWRITKPHFDVEENEQVYISKFANYPEDLLVLGATRQPSKPDTPKHPHINDITDCFLRSKQDQPELNNNKETIRAENFKDTDERENLLNQIRSKSFSLRRTVSTRPSLPQDPPTNNKVAAILEKANAIRQAYVGSDGGDENWSDG